MDKKEQTTTNNIRKLRAEKENPNIICIREINENIRRIFNNQPLTRPLRTLNQSCGFRKRYELAFDLKNEKRIEEEKNKRIREYKREYYQKPEVKKKMREYKREYYQKCKNKKKT